MSPMAIALIAFVCVFGGAIIGMILHVKIPERHLDSGSMDTVKLVMGLIGTMAALVLGLLIASAKGSFDTQNDDVEQVAADVLQLHRVLVAYGPEARDARDSFRELISTRVERIWPSKNGEAANLEPFKVGGKSLAFLKSVQSLSPQTDVQRFAKDQALQIAAGLSQKRVLMYVQSERSIASPFLVVLVSWLVLLFVGFGLLTKFNGTVVAALFIGALSVAGAIFLILELYQPYGGLIQVSSAPLRAAISQMSE